MTLSIHSAWATARSQTLFSDLSAEIKSGECVGIMGPNGAGKSTLLSWIFGTMQIKAGEALLDGRSITHLKTSKRLELGICCLPQESIAIRNLSIRENLQIFRRLDSEPLMESLNLTRIQTQKVSKLSAGERRKLDFVLAIKPDAKVVLLDEPFAGIDEEGRINLVDKIKNLKNQGRIILLADHHENQIAALATQTIDLSTKK